jgi:hypothetical protein
MPVKKVRYWHLAELNRQAANVGLGAQTGGRKAQSRASELESARKMAVPTTNGANSAMPTPTNIAADRIGLSSERMRVPSPHASVRSMNAANSVLMPAPTAHCPTRNLIKSGIGFEFIIGGALSQ